MRFLVHSAIQKLVLAQPVLDVAHVAGSIKTQQLLSQRPSYTNAVLIQSRGIVETPGYTACVEGPGLRPFPVCRRLPRKQLGRAKGYPALMLTAESRPPSNGSLGKKPALLTASKSCIKENTDFLWPLYLMSWDTRISRLA